MSDDMDNRANTSFGSAMDVDEPVANSEVNLPENHDDTDDDEDDPSDVAMVPMADLLNARWRSENAKLFYEPHVLRMATTKPIKKGEQIVRRWTHITINDQLTPLFNLSIIVTPLDAIRCFIA